MRKMANTPTKWAIVSTAVPLGTAIIGSYVWMYREAHKPGTDSECFFGSVLKDPIAFHLWACSEASTYLAWGWLLIYWLFVADPHITSVWGYALEDFYKTLLPVLLVFLTSALAWTVLTVWHARKPSTPLRRALTTVLWITALSSLVVFFMAVGTRDAASPAAYTFRELLVAGAGFLIAGHHIYWHAMVWDRTWQIEASDRTIATASDPEAFISLRAQTVE